ncbi:hypothetical protein ACJD0Z_09660 [Flavobacteriaceae bacterium M23B6Z8]
MKKNKTIFNLNKKTVSSLNKSVDKIAGGARSIIKIPTTDPTAQTFCFWCPPETFE